MSPRRETELGVKRLWRRLDRDNCWTGSPLGTIDRVEEVELERLNLEHVEQRRGLLRWRFWTGLTVAEILCLFWTTKSCEILRI